MCGCLETNLWQDPLSIFMKSIKLSSESDSLSSIIQSKMDFEQIFNKLLEALGPQIRPSKKYSHFFLLSVCYMGITLPELGCEQMLRVWSTQVAGFEDMSVLVCSVKWSVSQSPSNRVATWPLTMTCLSGKGHGKKKPLKYFNWNGPRVRNSFVT